MSQLVGSDSQPGNWEELFHFLRRLGTERFQEQGWQEPSESRDSRTVLWGTGGETPPVYPTVLGRFLSSDKWYSHEMAIRLVVRIGDERELIRF
jgi:hypothetical protein